MGVGWRKEDEEDTKVRIFGRWKTLETEYWEEMRPGVLGSWCALGAGSESMITELDLVLPPL